MRIYLAPITFYFALMCFDGFYLSGQQASDKRNENKLIAFDRLVLQSDSNKWMIAYVNFTPKEHPNKDGAVNEKFIDGLKLNLHLCFHNKSRERKILKDTGRKAQINEILDFYYAQVEIPTIEVDSRAKSLAFLLPLEIAKRDGFDRESQPTGYVVEFTIGDAPIPIKEPIFFENPQKGTKYRDEAILQNFKRQAIARAADTDGLLTPAHVIYPTYLDKAPAVKFPKQSN